MVRDTSAERKKQEAEALQQIREEKEKQDEF